MSFTRLFTFIVLSASCVLGHYTFGYPGFQSQLSPLVYSSGNGLGYNGFFYTGPTSRFVFNTEQLNAAPDAVQDVKPDGKPDEKIETSSVATTTIEVDSEKSEVTPAPEKKVDATTATPEGKDVTSKDPEVVVALINEQLLSGSGSGFGSPYPIIRFGGSASYYPHLSTPFTGFAGYQAADYFRPQYDPANNYFPYQSGSSPLFPSFDGDFYNPTFPYVYQHPAAATQTEIPLIDKRLKGHNDSEARTKTEDKTDATEEIVTKSDDTTTPEASPAEAESKEPTTVAESKEPTTVVESKEPTTVAESKEPTTVADSAAVP